jgi:uncharacterized lipoprotein YajG
VEDVVKKLLLFAGAALLMTACAESTTAPAASKKAPSARPSNDFTCRSGYVVAYDENGNPYCVAVDSRSRPARPTVP